MSPLDGVEQDFGSFLNAFEERIVFGTAGSGFLVGMVAEDFLAVGALDLVFRRSIAVFAEAENGVMILALRVMSIEVQNRDLRCDSLPSNLWHPVGASMDPLVR